MVSLFAWVQLCRRYYYRPGRLRDGFLGQGRLGSQRVWLGRKTNLEGRLNGLLTGARIINR